MSEQSEIEKTIPQAWGTYEGMLSLLKWGGLASFLLAAFVIYLIH